jgi:predicted regulator of Ras-like GTPase activity (Roadblock/LC7/MglB family)
MVEIAVPATTDTKVLALVKGPAIVSKAGLVLDATYNLDAEKAAVYAALEAKGIACNDAI